MTRKQVDDVLGGDDAWKHADSTTGMPRPDKTASITTSADKAPQKATCPKCDNDRAYFYQLQIRSADEPMTTCKSLFLPILPYLTRPLRSLSVSGYNSDTSYSPFMHLLWLP
jgi:uncharacterized paraquat-inducible protein A